MSPREARPPSPPPPRRISRFSRVPGHVPSPAPFGFGFRPQTTTMLRRGRSAAVRLFANLVVVAYAQTATDDDARSGCNGTVPAPAPQDSQCEPCPYCLHHIDHEASTFSSASRRPRVLLDVVLPLAPSLLALTIARQCGTELRAPSFVVFRPRRKVGSGTTGKVLTFAFVIILVCFSGLFSGLTLGLLGLDKIGLEIVMGGEDEKLKRFAQARSSCRRDRARARFRAHSTLPRAPRLCSGSHPCARTGICCCARCCSATSA